LLDTRIVRLCEDYSSFSRLLEAGVPRNTDPVIPGIVHFAFRKRKLAAIRHEELALPTWLSVPVTRPSRWLHRTAVASLVVALGVLGLVTVAAFGGPDLLGSPNDGSALVVLIIIVAAIVATAAVELRQTRRGVDDQ